MNIITRKIEIYVNESEKDIRTDYYKLLRDYEYNTYKYANEVVQLNYLKDIIKGGIGNVDNNITPKEISEKISEFFGCSERNIGYKFISDKFKGKLPSTIRTTLNSVTHSLYNNDKSEVFSGKRSIRSFKKGLPTPFQTTAIRQLRKTDKKDFLFELFGVPFSTKLGRDSSNNETILDRVLSGDYKLGDSSFQFKNNKLFLLLVVKMPKEQYKLDNAKILGIDLGINVPLYAAVNNTKDRISIGNREEFLNMRIGFQKRKRNLQKSLKITKGGKGRKHKLKPLDRLRDKESKWVTTYNHKLSKSVVDFALKNKCGKIHLEDLKNIGNRTNDYVLRNWSYFQLQTMIEQKAKRYGIDVVKVNPEYTSQRCFSCGYIDKENRKKQSEFICLSCGHKDNADHNAAKNISVSNTKEFIKNIKEYKGSLKICEAKASGLVGRP